MKVKATRRPRARFGLLTATSSAGSISLGLAFASMSIVQIFLSHPTADLAPIPAQVAPIANLVAVVLFVASALMVAGPLVAPASCAMAILWAFFAAANFAGATQHPTSANNWVHAAEAIVFSAAALARSPTTGVKFLDRRRINILRLLFGAMLLIFGAVHIRYHDVISAMIPPWIPFRDFWPRATSTVNLLAGLACILNFKSRSAALAVALMFGSWLPLVHGARLAASPADAEEWMFALTALALVGAALMIAGAAGARHDTNMRFEPDAGSQGDRRRHRATSARVANARSPR